MGRLGEGLRVCRVKGGNWQGRRTGEWGRVKAGE